ncbi:hypothetical protein H3N34_17985 [Photobacterium damselae subsp. damselae]|uniref:hypothetical protein n=1 Tax=Photobacterium damselae TaxID=38293 RepID=UPI0015F6ED31|nr:hypothetical protein [Photobacterium damselae]MBA5685061.1 hypothetical protein [Photobacterium damselae subsp. damselae]
MYKLLSFIFVFSVSTTVYAKITDADVDRDMRNLAAQNHFVTQGDIDYQWDQYNKPPNEQSSSLGITGVGSLNRDGSFSVRTGDTGQVSISLTGSFKVSWGACNITISMNTPKGKFTSVGSYGFEFDGRPSEANPTISKTLLHLSPNTTYRIYANTHSSSVNGKGCGGSIMSINYRYSGL